MKIPRSKLFWAILAVILIAISTAIPVFAFDNVEDNSPISLHYDNGTVRLEGKSSPNWVELTEERTRTTKIFQDSNNHNHYMIDSSIFSMHYQENNSGEWLEIDNSLVPSEKPNWDWEMEKSHWNLLVNNDGTIAAKKGNSWIGLKLYGLAYLEITTKDYTILRTVREITPVVDGNVISWENIIQGINFTLCCGNDRLKESIEITQSARDWVVANPPSSYGYNNVDTYLVIVFECDWSQSFAAELPDGTIINLDLYEGDDAIQFRDPIKNKVVTSLPVDVAYAESNPENTLTMRRRLISDFGSNWLLSGSSVLDLNVLDSGSIIFDPSIDEQVGASNCDAEERGSGSYFSTISQSSEVDPDADIETEDYRCIGVRFTGLGALDGATIDSGTYMEFYSLYTSTDDPELDIYADDLDNSPIFSASNKVTNGRTKSSTSVEWSDTGVGTGWVQSPELKTLLQEQSNDGHLSSGVLTMMLMAKVQETAERFLVYHYDYSDNTYGAKLHVEYTVASTYQPRMGFSAMPGSPVF